MISEPARLWISAAVRAPATGSPGRATARAPATAPALPTDGPGRRPATAGQGGRRLRRLGRAARRHWMVLILLVAGLALRVVTQLAYRPALLYIDSAKYLTGTGGYDPAGYAILLKPLLWAGNLAVVAGFQHLLGLAMAVALYATLIRRHAPRWAATLAAAPLLLDAYQLQMEQTIMPDVTFEALITTGLVILLWKPRPTVNALALGGFALGLSATVRQVGEVLIVPAVVFAVLVAGRWRRRLGYLAVTAAAFAVPVVGYLTISLVTGHGFALTTKGPDVLYGRAAEAAQCATLQLPAAERSLCPSPAATAAGIDEIINSADGPYQSYQPPPGTTKEQATHHFDLSVLREQPLAIPLSVLRDAIRLFAVTRDGAASSTPIARWQFQTVYPTYPPGVTTSFVAAEGQRYGGGGPVSVRPLATFLRAYQLDGGYTPGPLLALMTGAGVIGLPALFARHRKGADGTGQAERTDLPLAAAAAVATLSAVAVVLGADVFEFSWRYQLPALVTLPLAGVLGGLVIARTVQSRRARHQNGPPTGSLNAESNISVTTCNDSVPVAQPG